MTKYRKSIPTGVINSVLSVMALWGCSSCTSIFGGTTYHEKHGIESYSQAVIAASIPAGQVFFPRNIKPQKQEKSKWPKSKTAVLLKRVSTFTALWAIGNRIAAHLNATPSAMQWLQNEKTFFRRAVHMELLAFLSCTTVLLTDVPAVICEQLFNACTRIPPLSSLMTDATKDIEIILPYDYCYLHSDLRKFWKGWSKPAGELLYYAVYRPLGGRSRPYLSVPCLFAFNCFSHYDFSLALYGDRAIREWNKAFMVMGVTATAQIIAEKKTPDRWKPSLVWNAFWLAAFHCSMATTIYIIREKGLKVNLQLFCNAFLFNKNE